MHQLFCLSLRCFSAKSVWLNGLVMHFLLLDKMCVHYQWCSSMCLLTLHDTSSSDHVDGFVVFCLSGVLPHSLSSKWKREYWWSDDNGWLSQTGNGPLWICCTHFQTHWLNAAHFIFSFSLAQKCGLDERWPKMFPRLCGRAAREHVLLLCLCRMSDVQHFCQTFNIIHKALGWKVTLSAVMKRSLCLLLLSDLVRARLKAHDTAQVLCVLCSFAPRWR